MAILFSKRFRRAYKKLSALLRRQVDVRIAIFITNQFDPILSNHPLRGKFTGYRSINITGDYRAVYRMIDRETASFIEIGTHARLYNG